MVLGEHSRFRVTKDGVTRQPGSMRDVLTAADFVQAALQAEGVGDAPRRTVVEGNLEHDPEYGPALALRLPPSAR